MADESHGIATVASPFSVEETISKFKAVIAAKGLNLFAHIDHGAGAQEAGLVMNPAHVLIFGHARGGTPVMVARPLLALDLPLKILVWQDAEKKVWVSYNTPEFLGQRYDIPPELLKNIAGVPMLVQAALK
jgi:uncharacterized protein (DUF302 family)